MGPDTGWWRDAAIYQVYLRSLADSDGDGVGDLAGVRSRLPYLRDLGVDALWLTPWYPSPMADGGYDVADYRDIDPLFGTLAEAGALIRAAHEHGLRLIIDLVPNHTSVRHRWFQEALAAAPGSRARDRYLFRDGSPRGLPPNDWQSVFGGSAWTRVQDGQWYLHLFDPSQPDLNWENPEVRTAFEDILRFWFDRGVDGFRIDVAHGLIKQAGLPHLGSRQAGLIEPPARHRHPYWDRDEVHEIYRSWRRISESYGPDRIFVAEAWVARPDRLARYVRPDELHTAFNFDFLRCSWDPAALRSVIDSSLQSLHAVGAPATWVLSNHDVVRHVTRYGRPTTRGRGPQHEHGGPVDLAVGRRRARAALLLMYALPGGVYCYQGEELGLDEVTDLPESVLQDPTWERSGHTRRGRDGCRVPLPWRGTRPPFGFGPDGSTPWLPQPERWRSLTVAAQERDPGSMLNLYRAALRLRHEHPALGDGELSWLDSPPGVLCFRREPGLVCMANLSPVPCPLPSHEQVVLASEPLEDGKLPTDTAVWLQT
ncbi:glycoside hydrolase family 13 protein [Amycolatopsis rhizosphaerae]|uniref:Glycoside hydrolase family 13 protein n=1 Tax=Amycolatopsis rhizosphaerae TaxID=2053003 RepID=A0A558C9B5_9PSEU|nr:glycoside hydrolase family 13 protein [Amycolatopsis rhizosphaerae]TVT45380.1 glycoside hydrolase family 13 protein [Amycolatopsis rhizosphaerae]